MTSQCSVADNRRAYFEASPPLLRGRERAYRGCCAGENCAPPPRPQGLGGGQDVAAAAWRVQAPATTTLMNLRLLRLRENCTTPSERAKRV